MSEIHLTHRALEDLQDIYDYSVKEWGKSVADKYLDEIQTVLILLQENPGLLKITSQISNRFKTYPLKRHWLICDVIDSDIYILTIRHVSMNLLERLKKLAPSLEQEALALYKRLKNK